jgi:exopolyphosphatase/guanosine-5'-triphosphate,3'-diphosphate pyrophosphatase
MQADSQDKNDQDDLTIPEDAILAAIDLGSNSFHLIIARVEHEEVRTVETLSEKVQLGAGLRDNRLEPDAIERGLACISRFKQVLDSVEPFRLRVVGTNALRSAHNRREFTAAAERLLEAPVQVIYGREEARLVYLGVAHTLADDEHSRLVVDIGGGSTEFIIGRRFEPGNLDSLQLGCVSYTRRFFSDGQVSPEQYKAAYEAARVQVSHIRYHYRADRWHDCVGSSGTLNAIQGILLNFGWSEGGITRPGIACLEAAIMNFERMEDIDIEGLGDDRRNVICAGLAIAAAIFDELQIEIMRCSRGALREGVIYDLLGRLSHEDVRERTVNALMQRYNVDADLADMVHRPARILFLATRKSWALRSSDWELLSWAARTHEIGRTIAHKHYNRHGAYLLRNADLPGFSQEEQEVLAWLVMSHRGKLTMDALEDLNPVERDHLMRLTVLLRLAHLFKYVNQPDRLPDFLVHADSQSLRLEFPPEWLAAHPLTAREMEAETTLLAKAGFMLAFADAG